MRIRFPGSSRQPINLHGRLADIPCDGLPLEHSVEIRWNDHQVPFITAQSDRDLAVALGMVHVHLRWAQLEFMRHIVQGRVSELAGPFGLAMDRMLRTIDLPRAVPAIEAALPDETRAWISGFVDGMNVAVARLPRVPPEFRLLGLSRVPWSVADVLSLTRLAAIDTTWMVWLALLSRRRTASVTRLWRRLLGDDTSFDIGDTRDSRDPASRLHAALMRFSRPGSNSWAVAPARSASGGAWMANDTHLSPLLPNLWLLAGYRSPAFHAVGLMVPGIPAILVGRNPAIAWGGTNLHAASSDLFDLGSLPDSSFVQRKERVKVRGWGTRTVTVRDSEHGPVLSDLPRFAPGGGPYALRWVGHAASDEISGLLAMNRATDWDSFRSALNEIAVPGQNILYADASGRIAQAMAAHLPRRPPTPALSPVLDLSATAAWDDMVRAADLPMHVDPPEGFVASANDRPKESDVLIGYFFSSNLRVDRLKSLLSETGTVDFAHHAAMQRDVMVARALPVRDRIVDALHRHNTSTARRLAAELTPWNGAYDAEAVAPLIHELFLFHIGIALHGKRMLRLYSSVWNTRGLLARDFETVSPERMDEIVARVVPRVWRDRQRHKTWGALHRLEPRHALAAIPVLGRFFRFVEWPTSGGSDTVMKTANSLTTRPHHATLASTARHISDLSDVDANWFVLLGGQDGWLGSTTLTDQTTLWRNGEYMQMPLSQEGVERLFPHETRLHA